MMRLETKYMETVKRNERISILRVPRVVDAARRALPEADCVDYLSRLLHDDPHVGAELRRRIRESLSHDRGATPVEARTVADLRARAAEIAEERESAARAAAAAERERREKAEAEARKKRLDALASRGESAWREVEGEIDRRNAAGYDRAAALLADLRELAAAAGSAPDFARRLTEIRRRHAQKGRFLERLDALGLS
jgi:hypothetical protein